MPPSDEPYLMTFAHYQVVKACEAGANIFMAFEAVSSTRLAHPEWPWDEKKTYVQWEMQEQ